MNSPSETTDTIVASSQALRHLSTFERTAWSAWIVQQIVAVKYPEDDWSQVTARAALNHIARLMNSNGGKYPRRRQDFNLKVYAKEFLRQIGPMRDLALLSQSDQVTRSRKIILESKSAFRIVYQITWYLLALQSEFPQHASLSRAQYLCVKCRGYTVSTVARSWAQFGKAAHLISAAVFVYGSPALLTRDVRSIRRSHRSDDITEIFIVAEDIKTRLSKVRPKRSKPGGGVEGFANTMASPQSFPLWDLNTTLGKRIEYLETDLFLPSLDRRDDNALAKYSRELRR